MRQSQRAQQYSSTFFYFPFKRLFRDRYGSRLPGRISCRKIQTRSQLFRLHYQPFPTDVLPTTSPFAPRVSTPSFVFGLPLLSSPCLLVLLEFPFPSINLRDKRERLVPRVPPSDLAPISISRLLLTLLASFLSSWRWRPLIYCFFSHYFIRFIATPYLLLLLLLSLSLFFFFFFLFCLFFFFALIFFFFLLDATTHLYKR